MLLWRFDTGGHSDFAFLLDLLARQKKRTQLPSSSFDLLEQSKGSAMKGEVVKENSTSPGRSRGVNELAGIATVMEGWRGRHKWASSFYCPFSWSCSDKVSEDYALRALPLFKSKLLFVKKSMSSIAAGSIWAQADTYFSTLFPFAVLSKFFITSLHNVYCSWSGFFFGGGKLLTIQGD